MIDPNTCPTHADLSRADHRVLFDLCSGKDVVEFGCGGSTLFLAQIAKSLRSYDTDPKWIEIVKRNLPSTFIERAYYPSQAEVHFVDGLVTRRAEWVESTIRHRLAKTIIVHDTRRRDPVAHLRCLLDWPLTANIERVDYHYMDSNCLVITLRDKPVVYEDWNITEPEGRLPALDKMK